MTTLVDQTVRIDRQQKEKHAGQYKDVYKPFADSVCDIDLSEKDSGCRVRFQNRVELNIDDRIIFDEFVITIRRIMPNGAFPQADGNLDILESQLLKMEKSGIRIEKGFPLKTIDRDPIADQVMDEWVGTYAINIAEHYHEIKSGRHIGEFENIAKRNVPAVCVGAGPSLDKNIDELHRFPGIIICADRAYKMLLARKIEPDIVISIDCHYELVAEYLNHPWNERHTLILNVCADPKICDIWKGQKFWFIMMHPGVQFMDRILPVLFPKFQGLINAGCVGNSSVLLADRMGLDPVFLVGQDFSYTGGKVHADRFEFDQHSGEFKGKIQDNHAELLAKRSGKIEINGIQTYVPFKMYMETMYALRESMKINVINCTEGGILNRLPQKNLKTTIDELWASTNGIYLDVKEKLKLMRHSKGAWKQ